MQHRWRFVAVTLALAVALIAACGDGGDSDEDEREEVEQTIIELATTGPEGVDFFLEHVTDDFLEGTGYTKEECRDPDNVEDCVGAPSEDARVTNLEVDGSTAEADVTVGEGHDSFTFHLALVKDDDIWKLDSFTVPMVEIPEGVAAVDVAATEYAYQFDASAIADGNVALAFTNQGEEEHELVVLKVPDDFRIESVFGFGAGGDETEEHSELPPGAESIAGEGVAAPGESANVVFEDGLQPGRYVMVCFFQNGQGTAHVDLGMHAEFTIPN